MNTNAIIAVIVALVVVGGGGYYLTQKGGVSAPGDSMETQADTMETAEPGAFSGSFMDLAARTGSWQCTVDASTAQTVSSGIVYVSDGKVRANFSTDVEGYGSVDSYMIADGVDVYSWSSMMPQGIKTKMTAQGQGGAQTSGQSMDANQSYSYDCQPWSADASVFVVPREVTFREF